MIELPYSEFDKVYYLAEHSYSNRTYPLSVVEGVQTGSIFVDSLEKPGCALICHYCGFYYLLGRPNEHFLAECADLIRTEKSKVKCFFIEDNDLKLDAYFLKESGIIRQERHSFRLDPTKDISFTVPNGFVLKELDATLLSRLEGNIIPSFSWDSMTKFLKKGKGYCLVHGNEVATVAFSSAVSHDEIDIGIETKEAYRKQGLAAIVAKQMIQYIVEEGKTPTWECYVGNLGSKHTAEKAGFALKKTYCFFKADNA